MFLLPFSLAVFTLVSAQSPPQVCGDGVVQSPNDDGQFEKCDEGSAVNGDINSACTATCGEKMLGWAWADNFGWLSLSCQNLLSCGLVDYYAQISEENKILGWAWSENIGWICFGETCGGQGGASPTGGWQANIDPAETENPKVRGWGKILSLGDGGWVSLGCDNDSPPCSGSNYQTRLIKDNFGEEPNIIQRSTLSGWGWNSDNAGVGIGWIQFNPPVGLIPPWLQTKYGDIYARGGLTGLTPPGFNATYRILANGQVSQFYSAKGNELFLDPSFGPIDFPTPATRFSNILGKLDVPSLLCDFAGSSTCLNRFGTTVVNLGAPGQAFGPRTLLGGKIYYNDGNLTIDDAIEFLNGENFENGAGTVIIDGDLMITADLTYDSTDALERFRNLAAAAWIVRGDLKIGPNVKDLAGNFIVLGNGTSAAPNNCDPSEEVPGCGQIYSCEPFNAILCDQNRLSVSGLLMARKFYLKRTFIDETEEVPLGSELIIYDGRLLANTPPGLTDFAKALPIWRSGTFSQ
ncbi:hypothetical protein HYZ76_00230 [Candidatus Falkowbacteria bacterium]|nr:hypothetical protein [Candidatus Falkowbacteria bacterium]